MENRLVRVWADYVLYHCGGKRYRLLLISGEPIGPEIVAENDETAIKLCAEVSRKEKEAIRGREALMAKEILTYLEGVNHGLLSNFNDDDLSRFKNILFVWHDLSRREMERRLTTRGQGK